MLKPHITVGEGKLFSWTKEQRTTKQTNLASAQIVWCQTGAGLFHDSTVSLEMQVPHGGLNNIHEAGRKWFEEFRCKTDSVYLQ